LNLALLVDWPARPVSEPGAILYQLDVDLPGSGSST
jgi:hypothetical protein